MLDSAGYAMMLCGKISFEEAGKDESVACYPCVHCNKCGMYSARAEIVCAACKAPIPVGAPSCPACGGKKFESVRLPDAPPGNGQPKGSE